MSPPSSSARRGAILAGSLAHLGAKPELTHFPTLCVGCNLCEPQGTCAERGNEKFLDEKGLMTPSFEAARASRSESAAVVVARRGNNASARSSSVRRRAIPDARS
jgi:hypothetical protein